MSSKEPVEPGWILVDDYVAGTGLRVSEVVSLIMDGHMPGGRFGDRWYVTPPLVSVQLPEPADFERVQLTLSVFRMGAYLTAGRHRLVISMLLDDQGVEAAFESVSAAMKQPPLLPVDVVLGGQRFRVDSSLWLDLSAALVEIDVLRNGAPELGDDGAYVPFCSGSR